MSLVQQFSTDGLALLVAVNGAVEGEAADGEEAAVLNSIGVAGAC